MARQTDKNIKQDINMLEYPLWMQDEKIVSKLGENIGFVWTDREGYEYRCGYKPPTKLDAIFLLYLLYRSQKNGWKEEIELSRYEILKNCGFKSIRPADYKRLEDSFDRWKMVGVRYKGTFYDGKSYITLSFGIIDTWKVEEKTKKLYIRFNKEWLTRIKNSTYFKYIDFERVKLLRSPLSLRLYEILIKSFQNRDEWRIECMRLAEKIPLKARYPSHVVAKVKAATNRINKYTDLNIHLDVEKSGSKMLLVFRKMDKMFKGSIFQSLVNLLPESQRKKQSILEIIEEMLDKHGEEYVRRNILYTNENVKNKRSYRVFLTRSLREDWARGWWEDKSPEITSLFPDVDPPALEENKRVLLLVERALKSLSEDERAELRAQALMELPEDLREDPSAVRMQMRFILKRKLLENSQGDLP